MASIASSVRTHSPIHVWRPRRHVCLGILVLALVVPAAVAHAQVISNPRSIRFPASVDQNTLDSSGEPVVGSYSLRIFPFGIAQPLLVIDLGKPSPDADGSITADVTALAANTSLKGQTLEARLVAIGPGGSTTSVASNAFVFGTTSTCTYSVSPLSQSFTAQGGTATVSVSAPSGCSWTAKSNSAWLAITGGASGSGGGTVTYTAAANTGTTSLSGTLSVATSTVSISVAGAASTSSSAASSTPYTATAIALPGTFHAENFDNGGQNVGYYDTTTGNTGGAYRTSDVDLEASSLGGYDVGWIEPGEWLAYTVNVTTAGTYTFQVQVASPGSTGQMHATIGTASTARVTIPNTGGWQIWQTVTLTASLSAGPQVLKLVFDAGGFNVAGVTATTSFSTPYRGTPIALPGSFHAEDFDNGGQNVAYYDTTAGNSGGAYRSGDVDIETRSGGGYSVGWIASGEWLAYTVNVASAGTYTFQAQVASPYTTGRMHATIGSASTASVAIPNTGAWQTWATVSFNVDLTAGQQTLKLVFDGGGFNIAGIAVSSAVKSTSPTLSTPYSGTAAAIPGTIQAVDFDNGGQNVAYYDTTSGNAGKAYRSTDVDIQASSLGGYNVGWIKTGEWLAYSVNVASAGTYTLQVRVASTGSAGRMHATFGSASTAVVAIPSTGGWQTWTTVNLTATLSAGPQVMKLVFDSGGFNVAAVTVK